MLSRSKQMKSPVEVAVAIKKKKPGKGKSPEQEIDDMHDDMAGADEDEHGLHDGDMLGSPGGDDDAPESSGMNKLFGGDDDDGDEDEQDEDDEDDGDGDEAPELDERAMKKTSLADATPEQLQAALMMKRREKGGDDDQDGMSDTGSDGGGDATGAGDYI